MNHKRKLKTWVVVVLTIGATLLADNVIVPAIKKAIIRDAEITERGIEYCTKQTGNRKQCEREIYGSH